MPSHKPTAVAAAAVLATKTTAPATEQPLSDEVPRGYMRNSAGGLTPTSKVAKIDLARDALVNDLATQAKCMSKMLAEHKAKMLAAIEAFVQQSAAEYGVQVRGAAGKGNVTLTSYDGRYKVERQVADRIAFDERLQVAKQLIDECLLRWSKGANHNYKAVVDETFRVDKAGNVSVSKILNMRTWKIEDEAWRKAMDAVTASMHAASSMTYVRFYERDANGQYQAISLNAAAV